MVIGITFESTTEVAVLTVAPKVPLPSPLMPPLS
jgi:hypothetical protein